MTAVRVVRPGMLTTVQDLGRWGYQDRGVPVSGPMDPFSFRLANRLVGNADGDAALEITLIGPELEFVGTANWAAAGAGFALTLDEESVPMNSAVVAKPGARLRFGARHHGARAYLAVGGGFDVPVWLGSRSTHLVSRTGPFGRPLKRGDTLPVAASGGSPRAAGSRQWAAVRGGARLRVMWGPQDQLFTPEARAALTKGRYRVTPESDRMGYRLEGPQLQHVGGADILSDGTPMGTLQVPASGQPILLMAERQTTGGYAKIATVISADLMLAGQLAPGDWIEFEPCERQAALNALREREQWLAEAAGDVPR